MVTHISLLKKVEAGVANLKIVCLALNKPLAHGSVQDVFLWVGYCQVFWKSCSVQLVYPLVRFNL